MSQGRRLPPQKSCVTHIFHAPQSPPPTSRGLSSGPGGAPQPLWVSPAPPDTRDACVRSLNRPDASGKDAALGWLPAVQPGVQAPTKAGSETFQDHQTLHSGPLNPLPLAPGHPPSASHWVVPCGAPLLFPSPSHSLLGEPRPLLSFRPQTCDPSPGSPLSSHWLHDASPGKPLQRDASHTRLLILADPSTLPPQKLCSLDAEANALGSCPLFRACTHPHPLHPQTLSSTGPLTSHPHCRAPGASLLNPRPLPAAASGLPAPSPIPL